jgi:hypothetical protein
MHNKPIANIILNGEKQKSFPMKSRMIQGYLLCSLLFNRVFEFLARAKKQEKEMKEIHIVEKKEVQLLLFVDDMILYVKTTKYSTRNLDLTLSAE